jgi:TetR/AcrR family acrAB operon transcriptional repressor
MAGAPAAADDSRARILAAAQALFRARGSEGVTIAEVAEQAGVARATVFNRFGSKHALVEAITEGVFAGYQMLLEEALADRTTPAPALVRSLFEKMGAGIEADRRFYRAVFREIAKITVGVEEDAVAQHARQAAIGRLVQLLTRGQARGELARGFDAQDLATAFDGLVFGTITHWLYDDASEALHQRMRRAAEIYLGAVELRRAPARAPRTRARRRA